MPTISSDEAKATMDEVRLEAHPKCKDFRSRREAALIGQEGWVLVDSCDSVLPRISPHKANRQE